MTVKTYTNGENFNAVSTSGHGFLGSLAATVVKWQERSSMRHHLDSLDNEYLADMGLSTHQAQTEAAKPFWQS